MYLVQFTYDHYCQGYEDATITVLVTNTLSFADACRKIMRSKYKNPRDFINRTI